MAEKEWSLRDGEENPNSLGSRRRLRRLRFLVESGVKFLGQSC